MGVFSWGLKNEFETAMVNESSVFEPLKFYCSNCEALCARVHSRCIMFIFFFIKIDTIMAVQNHEDAFFLTEVANPPAAVSIKLIYLATNLSLH